MENPLAFKIPSIKIQRKLNLSYLLDYKFMLCFYLRANFIYEFWFFKEPNENTDSISSTFMFFFDNIIHPKLKDQLIICSVLPFIFFIMNNHYKQ